MRFVERLADVIRAHRKVVACMWVLPCGLAAGAQVSYSHVELGYMRAEVQEEDTERDGSLEALDLSVSWQATNHVFLLAESKSTQDEGGTFSSFTAGAGRFWSVSRNTDFYTTLAWNTLEGGIPELGLGFRGRPEERLEFDARIGVDPLEVNGRGLGLLSVAIGARFHVTPALALGLDFHRVGVPNNSESGSAQRLSIRYDFGSARQ